MVAEEWRQLPEDSRKQYSDSEIPSPAETVESATLTEERRKKRMIKNMKSSMEQRSATKAPHNQSMPPTILIQQSPEVS